MKTLFNNLLLTNRLVYQQQAEQPKPAPEAAKAKPEETAGIPDKDFDKWFDKETEKTKTEGGKEKDSAKEKVAELDIDKYLKPRGSEERPIQLGEMKFSGAKDKAIIEARKEGERYQKLLAEVTDNLNSIEDPQEYLKEFNKLADQAGKRPLLRDVLKAYTKNNFNVVKKNFLASGKIDFSNETEVAKKPGLYTAEEIWGPEKGATTEVAKAEKPAEPTSKVKEVEKQAEKILTPEQKLGEKTVAAINKYAYILNRVSGKAAEQLVYNLKSTNEDMIKRGASYEALTNFNNAIVAMVNQLPRLKSVEEVAQHAQKIATEISDAKHGQKYEDKVQYDMYLERNKRV